MWRVLEFVPDVGIGESTDHVLAVQQSAEDLSLIARNGIKRFRRPPWGNLLAGGDAIQSADGVGWIVNLGSL